MQHYRCPTCGADAYSSATAALVKCPRCSESLEGVKPVPAEAAQQQPAAHA
jgi:ribosomal protein L37AE/L43A